MAILSIGELLGMGPSELSGLIPYSGLEYSGSVITGISGSAIGGQGGTDSATVSAIASAYAESAASSKVDQSAFDDCCSSVNTALSGISAAVSGVTSQTGNYIDWSSSGVFQPAGDYAYNSSLSAYQEITGMTAYQSAGDYAYNSSISSKLDNSASSTWYPMEGNPSGFLTEHQSLSGYATEEYVDSSVSGKQDASGMSAYVTTGDLSSKLDTSAVNFDGDSSHVTGISGVPLSAQGGDDCKIVYDANGNIYNSGAGNSVGYYGGAFIYGSGNSGGDGATAFGSNNTALGDGISIGIENSANFMAVAIGSGNIIHGDSFGIGIGSDNSGSEGDILLGRGNSSYEGHAIGWGNTAYYAKLWGEYLDGSGCYGIGKYNLSGDHNVAFVIGDGTFITARHDLMVISKSGEVTMYSGTADTVGLPLVATLRALSAWATANGWTGM